LQILEKDQIYPDPVFFSSLKDLPLRGSALDLYWRNPMSLDINSMSAAQVEEFLATPTDVAEILKLQRELELRSFDSYAEMLDLQVQEHMKMFESI
jgi:hypothetical protein